MTSMGLPWELTYDLHGVAIEERVEGEMCQSSFRQRHCRFLYGVYKINESASSPLY